MNIFIDRFHKISELEKEIEVSTRQALTEDIGSGDISAALIPDGLSLEAITITRSKGVFCGAAWVEAIIRQVDHALTVEWSVTDGDKIQADQSLFVLRGPARGILTAERTILNFVQLLSGTATTVSEYLELLGDSHCVLLDTRKTVPGLRLAQKYAVICGGGTNHRFGLDDAFLLKENHISAAGSIKDAILLARTHRPDMPVQVEVEYIEELEEAIESGANSALLDNFSMYELVQASKIAKNRIKTEASGNVSKETIAEIAKAGVDFISVGNLTKTVQPLDLSMRCEAQRQ